MNPRKLIAVTTAILMASASAFAAVKNGASLKGNEYTKGGNNAKGGGVIAWNSYSSLDPTAFSHDLSSGDLTVLKDGDYLVAVTVPLSASVGLRNTHRADLLVNGTAVPTALGESSYIRLAGGHSESSDHFAVLVALKANDVLTVKTTPTANNSLSSFIGTCSLYAELVEGDRNVFSASATEIQSGAELNVEPDTGDQGLVWTSARKGSGYSHSDGDAEITIKDDGNYMVYVNVPLRGNVARGSVGLTINLDDDYIEGARGQQGYIRNGNNHKDASIHFSGVISAEAGQVLTVITEQLAAAGSIKVQANRAASIFIEKLGDDGLYADSFTGTTAGENLNPNNKFALSLVGDGFSGDIIDDANYSNEGDSEENIVIKQAGNYLLSFNSTFTGGNARANPRVTVEVNGSVVPGATSLSHYNRHASGHDEVTGSFVALLSDLAVDDVVTVSVQREGNGGIVTSPEGGKVALQAKDAYSAAAGDQYPPRFSSFSGGLIGFSAIVEDSGLKLDAATLKATLNGEAVDVTVDSANGVNSINYAFTDFPPTGSEHALNIAFNDTGGNALSRDFAFTVTTQYSTVSPIFSMSDVNKDKGGFRVNLSQISVIQTEGPVEIHGNQWVNAEKQLRGEYLNPNSVDDDDNPLPYLNEADPDAWEGWSIAPADVDYVNMNQDEDGSVGNFGEDQMFPNIPGWGDSNDGIAGEFLTVLHLKKGYQTLGVSSDDGFRATIGLNFHDMESQQIGLFNGNRGINAASNPSLFNIVVTEEGYYPLRVLWWEGGGGANIEIFSIEDGEKVLVNDPDNENAIKAYNIGNSSGRSYFASVSPTQNDTFATENSISATIIEDGTKAKSGSIKVLFNGVEVDASIKSTDGVVTVTAEPDGGLGIGSHTAKIVFTETTNPETERSFEWSFEVTAFSTKMRDFVDGEPNPIAYWDFDFADAPDLTFEHVFNLESVITNAKYTDDMGGHTGEAGDRAMDFLTAQTSLLVPDGEFLNIASAFDKITVSLWQKNHSTPNSSSFWGFSPSSNPGNSRGIQAHIPWGNQQIFFDTAGCCGGGTQRINLANADFEWGEWHHYVFVKDGGHKSIWIDGYLFHEGDNSLALPSDFDIFYIGANGDGGNSVSGIIDDFAVFASALTEEQIIALSEGNTDILPEKREIEVPLPDIPILITKSPTGAGLVGAEAGISLRYRGIDFTDLSITVNDKAVDPTITSEGSFTTITANAAFSLGKNVIALSWNGESETWNFFQFEQAGAGVLPPLGLIGHWPLDETDGTIASDLSGNGNNGTLSGDPQWATGRMDGALEFDGGDVLTLPADTMGLDSAVGTVAFWVNMTGVVGGINTIWWGGDNTTGGGFGPENEMHIHVESGPSAVWVGGEFGLWLRGNSNDPRGVHLFSDPDKGDAAGVTPVNPILLNDGNWHHIAGTWGDEDGNAKLYFDGVLLDEFPHSSNPSYPLSNIYLGQMADGLRTFTGLLDDVAIWNRALSAAEVAGVISGGIPVPVQVVPGLIAYWPFDGNIDDAIGDSHGEAMGTDDISYDDGQFGMGIDLDGIDQFIQTPLANEEMFDFQDGTGFTVSAWLRVDGFTKNWQALIAKGEGNRWRIHRRGGENIFTGNGGNGDVSAGSTDVNDGEIHHVALVSDPAGGEVRFYVDGELEGTSGAPSIQSNDNPMMIGENPDAQGRTWDGLIDDVGIWNRPITEEEVALIYNDGAGTVLVSAGAAGAGGPPPPDNGWIFSEQEGETAAPTFGNEAGTLSGGVEWSTEDPFGSGGSVSFNGTDGTVVMEDLATAFNDLANFSLSMWIKANSTGIDRGFWEAVDSGGGDLWGLRYDSTGATAGGSNVIKLGITTSESGGNTNRGADQQESHEGTQTTDWQNIVMTWEDGVGFNLYIDGELDEPTLAMQNTAGTLALMDRFVLGDGAKAYWDGLIDEVAVWSLTLSADDAAWLAQNSIASLEGEAPEPELTLSAEDMLYDAQGASITLDGDASDWAELEFKSKIPFEKGGELVLFEEYGGGTWSGPADHSSAVAFAWDAENLYVGVVITDDTHQNPGNGWNGDSVQMVFANAAQDTVTHLYNYGLSDGGDVVIHNEKGPGGTEVSITRDDDTTTTLYEFKFPAASLGLDAYESGMSIGIGVCVNDGDTEAGQGGQKGWSGWGPYAAVYGKTASATGLVTLVGEVAGKPTISLVRNDDGTITVTFTGKLQAAPTVNGPWQDVDADSPLTLTPDQAQTFARAVSE